MYVYIYIYIYVYIAGPPPPGLFLIWQVPYARTRRKRTPHEEFVPGARGVLFLWVLDQGACQIEDPPQGGGFPAINIYVYICIYMYMRI